MKQFKKLVALLLAIAMCMVCIIPAMAAEGNYTFTLDTPTDGHTYTLYQVFTGDLSVEDGKTLSNIKLGSAWKDDAGTKASEDLLTELEPNGDGTDSSLSADNFIKTHISEFGNGIRKPATKDANGNVQPINWTDLEAGYYLVVDGGPAGSENDAISAYIVKIIDDVAAKPKTTVPTVEKKVSNADKDDWKEAVSDEIGQKVDFKLTATVPVAELLQYETYELVFHDTLSKGLTLVNKFNITATPAENSVMLDLGSGPSLKESAADGTTSFTVEIKNLLDYVKQFDSETLGENVVIEVTYQATINEDAVIGGDGNSNEVYLEYTNNPQHTGEGNPPTGETPPEEVYVFTFGIDGTKVDGKDNSVLKGAGFTLYKATKNETTTEDGTTKYTYSKDVQVAEVLANGGDEGNQFNFSGLSDGLYILSETTTPDGYNTCDDMLITVTVDEQRDVTGDDGKVIKMMKMSATSQELTKVEDADNTYELKANSEEKLAEQDQDVENANYSPIALTVKNNKGTILPSTGGMGTTIFYIIGAVLVVGAGVLLFTKKRMGSRG